MVNFDAVQAVCFVFLAGLTLCGLAGSFMELAFGRRLSFAEPFVSPRHVLRSLAAAFAAGPFMLVNDALAAREGGGVSRLALLSCMLAAFGWSLAVGILATGLAVRVALLLS